MLKRLAGLILGTALFLGLAACGDDDSGFHISSVSSINSLPDCSKENAGDRYFVESKDAIYACNQGEWIDERDLDEDEYSSSSDSTDLSSGSNSKKGSSSSRGLSSSDDEGSDTPNSSGNTSLSENSSSSATSSSNSEDSSSSEEDIPGLVVQGKYEGFYSHVVSTGVYARLLDNKLDYVDSTVEYKGSMDTSTNRFVVRGIPEDAEFVEIEIIRNNTTNSTIRSYVYQYGIVNVKKDTSFFINPPFSAIQGRIKYLVREQGLSFVDAKHQAETELQKAFGLGEKFHDVDKFSVAGTSNTDKLWATAITYFIASDMDFGSRYFGSESFVKNGIVEFDEDAAGELFSNVHRCTGSCCSGFCYGASNISTQLESLLDVLSGRGTCETAREAEVYSFKVAKDYEYLFYVTCSKTQWNESTTIEKDTYQWDKPCSQGEYKKGNVTDYVYFCQNGSWVNAIQWNLTIPRDYRLNPNIDYGELIDERDGKTYKTVKIGNKTWMAQNLDFRGYKTSSMQDSSIVANIKGRNRVCYKDSTKYCDVCGSMYNWKAAMNLNIAAVDYDSASIAALIQKQHQGICPEGWHIPTMLEFKNIVVDKYGVPLDSTGHVLRSRYGWGTSMEDPYGFSALPCGRHWYAWNISGYAFEDAGRQAYFLAYEGIRETEVRVQSSGYPKMMIYTQDHSADYHFSIRCVKND